MRRPAKNRATRAAAIKNGRYGSSRVRFPIQAPLKPSATSRSGPRQQVEARIAARPPVISAVRPVCGADTGRLLLDLQRLAYSIPVLNYGVNMTAPLTIATLARQAGVN